MPKNFTKAFVKANTIKVRTQQFLAALRGPFLRSFLFCLSPLSFPLSSLFLSPPPRLILVSARTNKRHHHHTVAPLSSRSCLFSLPPLRTFLPSLLSHFPPVFPNLYCPSSLLSLYLSSLSPFSTVFSLPFRPFWPPMPRPCLLLPLPPGEGGVGFPWRGGVMAE